MLADQDHPLEDAIAEGDAAARPDPALVVVYRTRGVPWLLVPPLLLLAGVAAIVIYRRAEVTERAAEVAWRDASVRRPTAASTPPAAPSPPVPDARTRFDALDELTFATGRPASVPAVQASGPAFDPTPPPAEPEPPKPAAQPIEPPREPETLKVPEPKPAALAPKPAAVEPKPAGMKPVEPKPAEPKPGEPKDSTTALTAPATVAPPERPAPAKPIADPFDPLVATPRASTPVAVEPPPPAEAAGRRDRVGFDPDAAPATLEPRAEPKPQPERPLADRSAITNVPPPAEQPFELDRPKLGGAGDRAAARKDERTQEAMQDEQAEAERRLAERAHLEAIKNDFLNPDPVRYRRHREALKAAARRLATEDRQPFHDELKRVIRERGWGAGPDIKIAHDRFGFDTVPEIMIPAARDLIDVGPRLDTGQKIRRMRQWGLPETMIIDDLYERELRKIGPGTAREPGAARNEDEAWVHAAWILLHFPPATARANPEPAAAPPR